MRYNYVAYNTDMALIRLAVDMNTIGIDQPSRGGGTKELPFTSITLHKPQQREILNPKRRASLAAQIAETMWVLNGRSDVEWLSHYLPRAADFSDDGVNWRAAYGQRLRRWPARNGDPEDVRDQLAWVIRLLRKDPTTRRAVLSIWDPVVDQVEPGVPVKDIPCNDLLHFLSRDGVLDLHVVVRSNDLVWGWSGINAFEWSTLLEVVAWATGLRVGALHFSTSSLHFYERHQKRIEDIGDVAMSTLNRDDLRVVEFAPRDYEGHEPLEVLDRLIDLWFQTEKRIRTAYTLEERVAARVYINAFPEPLLRAWLGVIYAYWHGDDTLIPRETRLERAWSVSTRRPAEPGAAEAEKELLAYLSADKAEEDDPFVTYVDQLHRKKDAAYGDSWCRRGETIGIMANIARKVDRLGKTDDLETAADTAIDLLVYLLKYRGWLEDEDDTTNYVRMQLQGLSTEEGLSSDESQASLEKNLRDLFDLHLAPAAEAGRPVWVRMGCVDEMIRDAYPLARNLWTADQGTDEYQGADHD